MTTSFTRGVLTLLIFSGLMLSGCYTSLKIEFTSSPPISEPDTLYGGPGCPVPEPPPRPPAPDPPVIIYIEQPVKERPFKSQSREGTEGNTRNRNGDRQKKSRR